MRGNIKASFIIALAEEHPMLPRLLQSIALQGRGLDDAEIIIAAPRRTLAAARMWEAVSGCPIRTVEVPRATSLLATRNAAARAARPGILHFMNPDFRLDRSFFSEMLEAATDVPEADIIYSDYVRMTPSEARGASGIVRVPPFEDDLLRKRDCLGPSVCIRTELFAELEGFREDAVYPEWDFHVRAAQCGKAFLHIAYPLLSTPLHKVPFRERALDGRGKAMIVIANPAYFHGHTLRWALSHLRGEQWAEAWNFKTIPTAMDVSRMVHAQAVEEMGGNKNALDAVRQFESNVIPFSA